MSLNSNVLSLSVIVFGYISLFAQSYSDNLKGPLLSRIMSDLNLTNTQAAWLFIVASITAFCGGMGTSHLIHKTSRKFALSLGWILVSAASVAFLFSNSFYILITASLLMGLGFGICGVMQNLMVTENTNTEVRSKALSGLHMMYAIGALLSPLFVNFFLSYSINWRIILATGGLLPLLLLIFSNNLKFAKKMNEENGVAEALPELQRTHKKGPFLIASSISFYVSAEILLSTRIPVYVEKIKSLTTEQAGLYLTGFFLFLAIGRILFTILKIKRSTSNQIFIGLLGALLFLTLGLLIHPGLISFTGFAMAPLYALGITRAAEVYFNVMSKLLGFIQALSSLFIILMNFLFGMIADHFGLGLAIWLGPIFLFFSFVTFFIHEHRLKSKH